MATTHADNAYYDGSEVTGPRTSMCNVTSGVQPHDKRCSWHHDPGLKGLMWHQSDLLHAPSADTPKAGVAPKPAVYETRRGSRAYIDFQRDKPTRYYYSGLFGGSRVRMFHILSSIAAHSEVDIAMGIMARVHDESHVNRYWASFPPTRIMTAAYMYPEAAVLSNTGMCPRRCVFFVRGARALQNSGNAVVKDDVYMCVNRQWLHCNASGGLGSIRKRDWCPRDEMHPWLWHGQECRKNVMLVPRILNVAKVKQQLIADPATYDSAGGVGETSIAGGAGCSGATEGPSAEPGSVSRWIIWSSDMHIGPISDLKQIWRGIGMETHDESLSAHCSRTRTCARSLRVLTADNGMTLGEHVADDMSRTATSKSINPMSRSGGQGVTVRERFYEAYHNSTMMLRMDAVVCSHPVAGCEVFFPLGLPIVLFVTTRFDLGRLYSAAALERWILAVRAIAGMEVSSDSNSPDSNSTLGTPGVVVANNQYDAAYVEYFTGIRPQVLPSLCRNTGGSLWSWPVSRRQVLLDVCDDVRCPPFRQTAMRKLVGSLQHLHAAQSAAKWELAELRRLYPTYTFEDLAQHPAIVLFPYQVSVMSLFERRAMGIPMFAPSLDLMVEWHMRYGLVFERRVDWQTAGSRRGSLVGAHDDTPDELARFDPNDERNPDAVRYWLAKSDVFTLPHVLHFDSFQHLLHLLDTTDLSAVSAKILAHHAALEHEVHNGWKTIFSQLLSTRPPGSRTCSENLSERSTDYSAALARSFPSLSRLY